MLQECYKSVTMVLQKCYKDMYRPSLMFQGSYKSITKVVEEYDKYVTRVLQECYKDLAWCSRRHAAHPIRWYAAEVLQDSRECRSRRNEF
jgi:hypothetical protein